MELEVRGLLLPALIAAVVMTPAVAVAQAATDPGQVTFTKDVAPIFQRSCQVCHRAGEMAPMSLLTYEEVRPWTSTPHQLTDRTTLQDCGMVCDGYPMAHAGGDSRPCPRRAA